MIAPKRKTVANNIGKMEKCASRRVCWKAKKLFLLKNKTNIDKQKEKSPLCPRIVQIESCFRLNINLKLVLYLDHF